MIIFDIDTQHYRELIEKACDFKKQGNLEKALNFYKQALRLRPDSVAVMNNLANILIEMARLSEAESYFIRALRISPKSASLHNNLGNLYYKKADFVRALSEYKTARELMPDNMQIISNFLRCMSMGTENREAIETTEEILEKYHDNPVIVAAVATVFEKSGMIEKARKIIEPFLNGSCNIPEVIVAFGYLALRTGEENKALEFLEKCSKNTELSRDEQIEIEFLKGDLYRSLGKTEEAFKSYQKGNHLKGGHWDANVFNTYISRIIGVFTGTEKTGRTAIFESELPVYIVGMPRSGTSLVAQILSMHHEVKNAGELTLIDDLIGRLNNEEPINVKYPEIFYHIDIRNLSDLAKEYLQDLNKISPDKRYIIDKMPYNFMHLGLIFSLFPNAKVIHVLRHPYDTCLSCYFQNFTGDHPFTDSLSSLAEFYKMYLKIMHHWEKLYSNKIFTVYYENLINDFDRQMASLVRFLNLSGDVNYKDFYKSDNTVHSASYAQVRKPLYKDSINRWIKYEKYLSPLFRNLKPEDFPEFYRQIPERRG